jgi:hypothetical protein
MMNAEWESELDDEEKPFSEHVLMNAGSRNKL